MKETRFKQTEIGEIPKDWEVKELGNYATIVRGGSPRPIQKYLTTNSDGINWIKIGDVSLEDKYVVSTEEKIIPAGVSRSREVHKGDFILSNSMSFGRPYILKIDGCIHDGWLTIQNYQDTFNVDFLYYLLGSEEIFKQYVSMAAGSSVQNLNKDKVSKLKIPLPPTLEEQTAIAKALSDVDNVISTLEKLIAKKKNIKQGTMQELLTGKVRVAQVNSEELIVNSGKLKETEIGKIPEDWEVKRLGEVFEFYPNNTYSRDCLNYSEGNIQNIHYGDILIKFGCILDCDKDEIPYINSNIKINFNKYKVENGDIIIADTAEDETVGKVSEVYNLGKRKLVSGLHTILCRPNKELFAPKWLGYFMNGAIYHNQLLPYITGIKVSSISKSSVLNTKVLIPKKEEQTAIAEILSNMDKEIDALNKKLQKYRAIKTGMMQQLLTGKIRLV